MRSAIVMNNRAFELVMQVSMQMLGGYFRFPDKKSSSNEDCVAFYFASGRTIVDGVEEEDSLACVAKPRPCGTYPRARLRTGLDLYLIRTFTRKYI